MLSLWTRINADAAIPGLTPPLLLQAGYTLAAFISDLDGLRAAFRELIDTENGIEIARRSRDTRLEPLRERMMQYRVAIELEFGAGHPFFESPPDLYSAPRSTPDAVTVNGVWDDKMNEAVLTWTSSSNASLLHYEIRVSPGSSYDSANAIVVGQVFEGMEELRTTQQLTNPGDMASFKVFVILQTGNTAESNAVTISRPYSRQTSNEDFPEHKHDARASVLGAHLLALRASEFVCRGNRPRSSGDRVDSGWKNEPDDRPGFSPGLDRAARRQTLPRRYSCRGVAAVARSGRSAIAGLGSRHL